MTRRSAIGVACQHLGGSVSWSSQKQKCIVVSTTEAKYIAAREATKDIIWLARLFSEATKLTAVSILRIDNMSAVKLKRIPVFYRRSKLTGGNYRFVQEKNEEGKLTVIHVSGNEQLADILTKPLAKDIFQKLCAGIMGH